MKLYLSYPMRKRNRKDMRLIEGAREYLEARGIQFYDPEKDEPGGKQLWWLQEFDFEQMWNANAVLAVWGPSTGRSTGVAAELEWARRTFEIPAVIWNPMGLVVDQWTRATVRNNVYFQLSDAVDAVIRQARFLQGEE